MLLFLTLLACGSPAVTEPAPFAFEMITRGARTLAVVDAQTRAPIQGAVVALQRVDSGQFLARAVVPADGNATLRFSRPDAAPIELIAMHPDYALLRLREAEIGAWMSGAPVTLSMQPR